MTDQVIWLIVMVLFILLETMTYQFVSIWFVAGSLVSLVLAMLGAPTSVQIPVFFAVSILLLVTTRGLVKKLLLKKSTSTNADRIVGETAVVTEEINNLEAKGNIRVFGQVWSARSAEQDVISKGENVRILRIEGVKAIVEKENKED